METKLLPWGERIRRGRLERGLTAGDLAKKAHVSISTIYGIEGGQRNPRPGNLRKILEALQKTPKLPEI